MRRIVAFNWPKLIAGAAVALVAAAAAAVVRSGAGWPERLALVALATGPAFWLVSSLAVSWWVYDRSDLHHWAWLRPSWPAGARPTSWALVHAGFDEAGPTLPAVFGAPAVVVDISPRLARISPSLRRARRRRPAATEDGTATLVADCPQLPLRSGSLDAIVMVFAAHEVRDRAQRRQLFLEFRRALAPGGRVVLVEHLRDGANMAAFGPGAWHFLSRRIWTDVAQRGGFRVAAEVRKTPFVRGWALCPVCLCPVCRCPVCRCPV